MNAYAMKQNALDDAFLGLIASGTMRVKRENGKLVRFDLIPLHPNEVNRLELLIANGKLTGCEECGEFVPKPCYLAGIQRELCENCAADHGSDDWK